MTAMKNRGEERSLPQDDCNRSRPEFAGEQDPCWKTLHRVRDTLNVIVAASQLLDRSFSDPFNPIDRRLLTRKIADHSLALAEHLETVLTRDAASLSSKPPAPADHNTGKPRG